MRITEPTTAVTDYILAAETVFLGILLLRNTDSFAPKLWAFSFFSLSIAAIAGGTYHGFIANMNQFTANAIWKATLYSIGIATALMLSAAFLSYLPDLWKKIAIAAAVLQLAYYVFLMARTNDFKYVVYNYVPAMIVLFILAIMHSNRWLAGAVLISFAGAGVQRSGFQLHQHFNHNDIYHVIQMVAMYFFYRGGLLLWERRL